MWRYRYSIVLCDFAKVPSILEMGHWSSRNISRSAEGRRPLSEDAGRHWLLG